MNRHCESRSVKLRRHNKARIHNVNSSSSKPLNHAQDLNISHKVRHTYQSNTQTCKHAVTVLHMSCTDVISVTVLHMSCTDVISVPVLHMSCTDVISVTVLHMSCTDVISVTVLHMSCTDVISVTVLHMSCTDVISVTVLHMSCTDVISFFSFSLQLPIMVMIQTTPRIPRSINGTDGRRNLKLSNRSLRGRPEISNISG